MFGMRSPAAELVRERTHVAGALHVVLAAQRIHAHALAAEVTGRHREVRDAHDRRRALAVFRHAEAVIDRRVAGAAVQQRRLAHCAGRYSGDRGRRLRRARGIRDEPAPALEGLRFAAGGDIVFLHEPRGHDHVRERVQERNVGSGAQLQMMRDPGAGRAQDARGPRVHHDEPRALPQPAFEP
jgi:hypothetical protein